MDENGAVTEIITLTKKKIKIKKHNMFVIWQGGKIKIFSLPVLEEKYEKKNNRID